MKARDPDRDARSLDWDWPELNIVNREILPFECYRLSGLKSANDFDRLVHLVGANAIGSVFSDTFEFGTYGCAKP